MVLVRDIMEVYGKVQVTHRTVGQCEAMLISNLCIKVHFDVSIYRIVIRAARALKQC